MSDKKNILGDYFTFVEKRVETDDKYRRINNQIQQDIISSILLNAETGVFYFEQTSYLFPIPKYVQQDIIAWGKSLGYRYAGDATK